MSDTLPDVMPEAITVGRDMAAWLLEESLAAYGTAGPVAAVFRWALYGQGPRPICRQPWYGGLPTAVEMEGETWFESGWGRTATYEEIRYAKGMLWLLQAQVGEDMPDRFIPARPLPPQESVTASSVTVTMG
jgi:hypothetical protein